MHLMKKILNEPIFDTIVKQIDTCFNYYNDLEYRLKWIEDHELQFCNIQHYNNASHEGIYKVLVDTSKFPIAKYEQIIHEDKKKYINLYNGLVKKYTTHSYRGENLSTTGS